MKKRISVIIAAVLLGVAMLAFSACSSLFTSYFSDGSSPYDAAVTRGETGSEESWLASLDAPTTELRRAYEEARADGSFTGSYFEFLSELGVADTNGAHVQTALLSVVSVFARFSPSRGDDYFSAGSGVIYSLDKEEGNALVITNYHVVYSADSHGRETVSHISDEIVLYLYGGEIGASSISATYLGGAMEYDIAVLLVEGSEMLKETAENPVYARELIGANTDAITVGEKVYAIGNADGEGISVTAGVVSVDAEYVEIYGADEKTVLNLLEIRTDAAVNHGNSGGGLFNASGELVGIVNARLEEDGVVGFGYAIPANLALSVAQNIIDTCDENPRARGAVVARLGLTAEVQGSRGVFDSATGKIYIEETVVISSIDIGTAASAHDLRTGDTLVYAKLTSSRSGVGYEREIAITRLHKLTNLLLEVRRGDTLELTVSRDGELVTIKITYDNNAYFRSLQ